MVVKWAFVIVIHLYSEYSSQTDSLYHSHLAIEKFMHNKLARIVPCLPSLRYHQSLPQQLKTKRILFFQLSSVSELRQLGILKRKKKSFIQMNSCGGANAHFWFGFLSSTQCTALLPVQFQCPNSTLLSITWWRLETSRKLNQRLC